MTSNPIYTIGHSITPLIAFVDILRAAKIAYVVDVRSIPRSRTNPQYNLDLFPRSLLEFQIEYVHIVELGGRRGRQRERISRNRPNTNVDCDYRARR